MEYTCVKIDAERFRKDVKAARLGLGLSQAKLAEAVGYSEFVIGLIERGRATDKPRVRFFQDLCEALGLDQEEYVINTKNAASAGNGNGDGTGEN